MGPTSAAWIGISLDSSSPTSASRDPMVSVLMITPTFSVSILAVSSSDLTSSAMRSTSSPSMTTLMVEPARAASIFGADTLTPLAAATCFTGRNRSSLLISERGRGFKRALILVTMGSFRVPTTMVSPARNSPS